MAPLRKSVNKITVDSVVLKRTAKVIEVAEPTNRWPTLSDVHSSDTEDSNPIIVSPLRRQTIEPEPLLNGD